MSNEMIDKTYWINVETGETFSVEKEMFDKKETWNPGKILIDQKIAELKGFVQAITGIPVEDLQVMQRMNHDHDKNN